MPLEVLLTRHQDRVDRCGFTTVGVEPNLDHPPWLYTVGLTDHDHPEIAALGVPLDVGQLVLHELGHRVVDDGETFLPDDELIIADLYLLVVEVDPRLWDGDLFNQWKTYYAWRGRPDVEPWAVELLLPGDHPLRAPNRATRRAAARRKRSP